MLNKTPLWKYLLIVVVVIPGLIYALPNLFGDDPGLQIRATRAYNLDANVIDQIKTQLDAAQITYKSIGMTPTGIEVRFDDADGQLKARNVLQNSLGNKYTQALSLLPSTPVWLRSLEAKPMYLGLDLRGGVHFLMEVDTESILNRRSEELVNDIKPLLRKAEARYKHVGSDEQGLKIEFVSVEAMQAGLETITENLPELEQVTSDEVSFITQYRLREEEIQSMAEFALDQNITALRNRIDELGVAEPLVQKQGIDRIVVQLPGVQDTARAKSILGRTATLEIMLVNETYNGPLTPSSIPAGSALYEMRDGRLIVLKKPAILTGENIIDAGASIDTQTGSPIVSITLDSRGAAIFREVTGKNIGKRMAVLYNEIRAQTQFDDTGNPLIDADGNILRNKQVIEEVITAPVIRAQLGKRFQIEGLDGVEEAQELALLLRAGAFAAPIEIIEERTVGPSLGRENIRQGVQSVLIGLALVLAFMVFYYRKFGLIANLALVLNLVLLIAVLSVFQATLTLPGVAGIVLTVGMAVDANVLIFERIREELRNKAPPQQAIHKGYEQAFSTILDANITTLIAAVLLFNFGTGPIKGFAITLSIGILTSMFTAIIVTRVIVNGLYGNKKLKTLSLS